MRLRSLLASICLLALPFVAEGQEAELRHDFRFMADTDPYLFLSNPAGLSAFSGHVSMAEAAFRKDNGGLASIAESPDSFKGGAETESYISISDRISFHGKLSWSYFRGERMGAQVLMDPDFNPFNFLESTETTVGRKNREDYSLLGAMSYRFDDRWSAGAGIEYVSADQTKVKDPRFTSVWMDLGVKAGVSFRPGENRLFGLSLQAVSGGFSNELEVLWRTGYYGKKSSATATFFEFSGPVAKYRGQLLSRSGDNLHCATVELGYELLGNDENIFKYVTPVGQNTYVDYTGKNHISDRHVADAALGYTFYKGVDSYLPAFKAGGTLKAHGLYRSTVLFPFYRNTSLITLAADAFAQRNLEKGKSIFSFDLGLGFRAGFGEPRDDGAYASTTGTSIQSFDNYLNRQYEFDTAPAASVGVGFGWTHRFTDRFAPYIKLTDTVTAMFSAPQYLGGRARNVALLTVGCSF